MVGGSTPPSRKEGGGGRVHTMHISCIFHESSCTMIPVSFWDPSQTYLDSKKYRNRSAWNGAGSIPIGIPGFDNCCISRSYLRLLLLAYTWFGICVHWLEHSFILCDFESFERFSNSYNLILFKNVLLYTGPLIYLFIFGGNRFFTV